MNTNPLLRHPAMNMLKKALLIECQSQLVALFLLLLTSTALLLYTFEESIIFPALGLMGIIISIQLIYRIARSLNIEEHRLIWLLKNQSHAIVWIYSVKTERLPFGFKLSKSTTLYFKLSDGSEISVNVPPRNLKVISRYLNRLLPHATFGYSHNRAQWFQIHPDMLRKEKEK